MNADQRALTLEAIREVCRYKNWLLLAAHVRSNHVHTVVDAGGDVAPEFVMNAFKSYSSRVFNLQAPQSKGRLRWARHGSTRYLRSRDEIEAAVRYVLEKQEKQWLVTGRQRGIRRVCPLPDGRCSSAANDSGNKKGGPGFPEPAFCFFTPLP